MFGKVFEWAHARACAKLIIQCHELFFWPNSSGFVSRYHPSRPETKFRVKARTRPRTTSSHKVRCISCRFECPPWRYSMRSSAPLFFCLCGAVVHGASVDPRTTAPWRQAVLQTETTLRKDCGEECVKVELAMGCDMRHSRVASNRFCTTCWLHQRCTTQRRAASYNTS
jgi:hypothetical protein